MNSAKVLERFRAKWVPVCVKKTRQIKNLEPRFDSIETGKALGIAAAVLLLASDGLTSSAIGGVRNAIAPSVIPISTTGSLQNPCFSPDGSMIVFTRFRRGYNTGASDIMLV